MISAVKYYEGKFVGKQTKYNGGCRFAAAKRAGKETRITPPAGGYTSSPPPAELPLKGSLLGCCQKSLPLEGKVGREAPRMRCSQPQLALSHPAPQREARSFLPQQKRRRPNAPRTKAAVRGAMLRGRAKRAEKEPGIGGKACFHSRASDSFSI